MNKESSKQHRIGLALSGGGAKGFAHIGAIKALEEKGVYPDVISGTSAGAVVAALYGAGISPEDMIDMFTSHEVKDFISLSLSGKSFLKYNGFVKFLEEILPVKNIEDLKIPVHIIATNFDKGVYKDFTKGELIPRIMASCTLPVTFEPIKINCTHYVDGGLFKNLPVSPIRNICENIIAINVSPYLVDKYKENIFYIAAKSYQYIFKANTNIDKEISDWILEIDSVLKYKTFDLKNARDIYNIGYCEMSKALENITDSNHFIIKAGRDYFKQKYMML